MCRASSSISARKRVAARCSGPLYPALPLQPAQNLPNNTPVPGRQSRRQLQRDCVFGIFRCDDDRAAPDSRRRHDLRELSSRPSAIPLSITLKRGCPVAAPGAQLVATTTVPVISITQGSGPVLLLGNPNANDVLSHGPLVVSGVAFDPASTNGAGVQQVEFFLNDRDAGGVSLGGTTVPGTANPALPRVYNTVVNIPANTSGLQNFVAYARSGLTGLETKVSVPVFIGAPPSPTPRS